MCIIFPPKQDLVVVTIITPQASLLLPNSRCLRNQPQILKKLPIDTSQTLLPSHSLSYPFKSFLIIEHLQAIIAYSINHRFKSDVARAILSDQGCRPKDTLLRNPTSAECYLVERRWQQQRRYLQVQSSAVVPDEANPTLLLADRNPREQNPPFHQVPSVPTRAIIEHRRVTEQWKRYYRKPTMRLRTSRKHPEEAQAKIDRRRPVQSQHEPRQATIGPATTIDIHRI